MRAAAGSPDEAAIYYTAKNPREKISRLMKRDLDTGQEKELFGSDNIYGLALSPDGKRLAFGRDAPNSDNSEMRTHMVMVLPMNGGEPRELLRLEPTGKEEHHPSGMAWSPDGMYLLIRTAKYSGPAQANQPTELWRIPAEGGDPEVLDLKLDGMGSIEMQPNGPYLAFETLLVRKEIWVMENILEELQAEE